MFLCPLALRVDNATTIDYLHKDFFFKSTFCQSVTQNRISLTCTAITVLFSFVIIKVLNVSSSSLGHRLKARDVFFAGIATHFVSSKEVIQCTIIKYFLIFVLFGLHFHNRLQIIVRKPRNLRADVLFFFTSSYLNHGSSTLHP